MTTLVTTTAMRRKIDRYVRHDAEKNLMNDYNAVVNVESTVAATKAMVKTYVGVIDTVKNFTGDYKDDGHSDVRLLMTVTVTLKMTTLMMLNVIATDSDKWWIGIMIGY